MPRVRISRSLLIVGWFGALLIFNVAAYWSQNGGNNRLFIFLEALGRLTTPAELLVSALVVSGVLASGARHKSNDSEVRTTKRRPAVNTAYALVGTLILVLAIGFVVASRYRGATTMGQRESLNPDALNNYALLERSSSELGTKDDGLSPDTKKRMREGLALQLAGVLQKQNNPIRVDVTGVDHDILVFQRSSMNDEMAEEFIQELRRASDANFWNAARLMNYSQVVFLGSGYKRVINRAEFVAYGKDYDKYKEAFLKAATELRAGAQGEVSHSATSAKPFATLPTLANLKAQMKAESPGLRPQEFKRLRAATGWCNILSVNSVQDG